ncbi:MAG TPA: AsmA-like C-terminal region-containing protein [Gemmatimonadales bacterium]|nr:AsmA-like C-terminal region-containing protein [Gemmatimonadales bacterium]
MRTNTSLRRRWLYGLIGLTGLLIVLAVVALQALKSETARSRIATALSSALGQPVTIGGLSASVFHRPSLSASAIQVGGADPSAAPGVSLAAVRIVPRLSSLIPGRTLTIDRVDLRGLVISVRRDSGGRWLVPVPPTPKAESDTSEGKSGIDLNQLRAREGAIRVVDEQLRAPNGGPTVTMIKGVEADMQAVGGEVKVSRFAGRLGQSVVTGSMDIGTEGAELGLHSESIHNADLPALFALAGMPVSPSLSIAGKAPFEMKIAIAPGLASYTVVGQAAIERVKFGTLSFEQVQAPFQLKRAVFTLDPLTFTTYGGSQRGVVSVDLNSPTPVYSIRSTVQGMDVDQALSANTTMKNFLAGRGSMAGDVTGSGTTAAALKRTLKGTLKFELEKGVIRNFPLLAAINQSLGITTGTGQDTEFQRLSGTATIAGGKARTNDLALRAGELTLAGKGTVDFDRRLDLRMKASASPGMSNQLVQRVGVLKQLSNDKGQVTFPVSVGGTTTEPKFSVDLGSLAQKQLEQKVEKQVLDLMQ